jgi:hypothetical protein
MPFAAAANCRVGAPYCAGDRRTARTWSGGSARTMIPMMHIRQGIPWPPDVADIAVVVDH